MMNAGPPDINFVEFFHEKYLSAVDNGIIHPPALGADKSPDLHFYAISDVWWFDLMFLSLGCFPTEISDGQL